MAAALGQNKTMRFLVLNDSGGRLFESGLTQYSAFKAVREISPTGCLKKQYFGRSETATFLFVRFH